MSTKNLKKKRRRNARLLLVVAAGVILLLGIVLIVVALGNVLTGGGKTNDTTPTTAVADTTTTTRPTALFVDGHYVQQSLPAWNLRLVNGWNPLSADYGYEDHLIPYGNGKFDSRAAEALRNMLAAGKEFGLRPVSLFRAYDLQVKLFDSEVADWKSAGYSQAEAEQKASTEVARPGTSEHHLGLAADILSDGVYSLEESFENTAAKCRKVL